MVHTPGEDVVAAKLDVGGEIALKTRKTIRPPAHELAVEPYFGVVIHAIKFKGHRGAGLVGAQLKMFAIQPQAAGRVAIATAILGGKGTIAAPIVRQRHRLPAAV